MVINQARKMMTGGRK